MVSSQQTTPGTRVVKVDVIIAVYNADSTVEETVRSAMHQEIPDHYLINGCSSSKSQSRSDDEGVDPSKEGENTAAVEAKNESMHNPNIIHFDICICCYNDASTDRSMEVLSSLEKERIWKHPSSSESSTMQMKLLIGSAPNGTSSRGAGYARNQAVKLRDNYEQSQSTTNNEQKLEAGGESDHFLCILDSDDIMHPTRIAEQTHAMLLLNDELREKTLMGCWFDRIPKDSTQHYARWANSLSDERVFLEQFRECTLLQPTWFLAKKWFQHLGGYLEAPQTVDDANPSKKAKLDPDCNERSTSISERLNGDKDATDSGEANKQYYRLIHQLELPESTTNNIELASDQPIKRKATTQQVKTINTLRLAEDSRFFYAHLHSGGRLQLHRTSSPLVSYRHRSGMSQSSNTPRKLLLKLRAKAWEDLIFHGSTNGSNNNTNNWSNGFAIWGAGRDGKDFLKALSPAVASKVICFVDVDEKKIKKVKWYDNPALDGGRKIPILHFSVLAKDDIGEQTTFGRIEKKCNEDTFKAVSKHCAKSINDDKVGMPASKTSSKSKKKKNAIDSIDPEILQKLPVVVCVAMYRTNGALESNVASIGRIEGKDLWHIS